MNRITYKGYEFIDEDILSGSIEIENSMLSETLSADTFTFTSLNRGFLWEGFTTSDGEVFLCADGEEFDTGEPEEVDMGQFSYGEPVYFKKDSELIGKFYVKNAVRVGRDQYRVTCVSAVGLLIDVKYYGGIYNGESFKSIADDILSEVPHTIAPEIETMRIYGHLEIQSRRDALQQLLFQCGASILKDSSGIINIVYNDPDTALDIPDNRIFLGGSVDYTAPATSVSVTEHSYYASTTVDPVVLFENTEFTSADHSFIQFDNPVIPETITSEGLTIHETHPNYAIISGTGTLTGKEYVHIQRIISKSTGVVGETKQVSVTNATLINSINSNNCLNRIINYYSRANETSVGIVVDTEKPGDQIQFNNPFGDATQGYIKSMSITLSNILKSDSVVATNWKPMYLGNNFTKSIIIKQSDLVGGVYNVPAEYVGKPALAVMFAGGKGGSGGYDGKSGGTSIYKYNHTKLPNGKWLDGATWALGGDGGQPGAPGECGNMFSFSIDALAPTYSVTIGVGGAGGAKNGGEGSLGTPTTFGSHSTEEGSKFAGNYIDLITGDVYAKSGETQNGYAGGAGGPAGWDGSYIKVGESYKPGDEPYHWGQNGRPGEDVGQYIGGKGALFVNKEHETSSHWYDLNGHGSGGGGSAFGANGQDAQSATPTSYSSHYSQYASKPGNGANASAPADETLGSAGRAGNGGGGGGARGPLIYYRDGYEESYSNYTTSATPGNGSIGGKAGDGFILLYV